MNLSLKYIVYAIIIILFQVLVAKHMLTGTSIDPYLDVIIYPLLILILPVSTPSAIVVILAFVSGMVIDFFYSSPGVHTFALVLIAFLRRFVLNFLEPRSGYSMDDIPLRVNPSGYWYFIYISILLFIHIFAYFSVTFFSLAYFLDILINTVLTFVLSLLLLSLHAIVWRALN